MSKPSALSISVLLIFKMQEINGALFSKTKFLSNVSPSFAPSSIIVPLTAIYVSL